MKRLFLIYLSLCYCFQINASTIVYDTVSNTTAGKLHSTISKKKISNVTHLTVTGVLDYNDFVFIRDSIPQLENLDIRSTTIQEFGESFLENRLPDYTFYDIKKGIGKHTLETVKLPQTLQSIGKYAFLDCSNLQSAIVPISVKTIETGAFQNCINLTSINVPSSLQTNDEDYYLSEGVFSGCTKLNSISIPDSISVIPKNYFERCISLTSIAIPSNIIMIYNEAFKDCIGLQSIYLSSSTPIDLSNISESANIFKNINFKSCILYVPNGSKVAYQNAKQWKDFINIIEIGSGTFKSVICNAGSLASMLSTIEKTNIENLVISNTIDARDFVTLRDSMPNLTVLDLSNVKIMEYVGNQGTAGIMPYTYKNNEIPINAFFDKSKMIGKGSLTNIILPYSSTSIAQNAFTACTYLHSVIIQSMVTNIGIYSFGECASLSSITIPSSVSNIADSAFANCSKLSSFTIPSAISTLKRQLLSGDTNITTLAIPLNITIIETQAFANCTGLKSIYVYNNNPIPLSNTLGTVTSDVFKNVNKNTCTLFVPFGSKDNYKTSNQWSGFLNIVEMLPNTINCTPGNLYALLNKEQKDTITHLNLSGIINTLDFVTMRDSIPNLTDLNISAVSIASYYGNDGTRSADIAYTSSDKYYDENTIPHAAFYNPSDANYVSSLKSIILPKGLTKIDINAFAKTKITAITIPPTVLYLSGFSQTELSSITIPASVTEIGDQAFSFTKLTSISLPPYLSIIDQYAFNGSKLKFISIPVSVSTIGNNAFASCNDLTTVTLSDSISSIMPMAFAGDTSLISINIPSKLTHISQNLLQECRNLKSLYIPSTITSIGGYAFDNCKKLKSIYANSIVPIDLSQNPLNPPSPYVFENIDKSTCILYVPVGSKVAYQKAAQWKDFTNIVEIKDIYFNHSIITLFEGESISITNSVQSTNNIPYNYKIKDETIASISTDGLLKSKMTGSTKMYLTKPNSSLLYDSTIVVVLPNIAIIQVAILGSGSQIELTLDKDFPLYEKMENDFNVTIEGQTENYKITSVFKKATQENVLLLQLNKPILLNKSMIIGYSTANIETGVTTVKTSFTIIATVSSQNGDDTIKIYPNPVYSKLNIEGNAITRISLYTIGGECINELSISKVISLESYPTGMYYLEITTSNSKIVKSIIKQ